MSISTRTTKLLGIKTPILGAPMYFASTPELTSAITAAGGFGFLPAGFETSQSLKDQLRVIRTTLGTAAGETIKAGVGFLGWILDNTETSDDPRIPIVLEEKPAAVLFAFGNDLGKYVAQVRAFDATREHKTIIFVTVNSVAEALRATNEWRVDVLVVQGGEAGGHGRKTAPPLLTLLLAVLTVIPREFRPIVVAAGGISSGAQIAALLTLGADGVLVGTRFLVSPECKYTATQKQVILDADLNSTSRNRAFDEVNRTDYWPLGIEGRAVANDILSDTLEGEDLETRLKKHDEGLAKGEKDRLVIWAGVGIGHLKEVKSAAAIMKELHTETIERLKATPVEVGLSYNRWTNRL